jgi:hypothetical protein
MERDRVVHPPVGWRWRLELNPFGTMAAIAAVVLGTLGIILGDGVSQGMTLSLHATANLTAHLWGATFATGGALKLIGLYFGLIKTQIIMMRARQVTRQVAAGEEDQA